MADRYTTSGSDEIRDGSVSKDELNLTNTPSDGDIIQINMPAGDFTAKRLSSINDYLKLEDNIMLNAFRVAINGSLTQQNMVDGIVDEYEDETGIDTANSTNEDYDATNDLYQPVTPELTTSPYAHYKLNDNLSGTTVVDDGTGANNGTASTNTVNLSEIGKISSKFNGCGFFDGSTSYLSVPDSADWTFGTGDFTIEAWINTNDKTALQVIAHQRESGTNEWTFRLSNSELVFSSYESASYTARYKSESITNYITDGQWHHIAVVRNGSTCLMFIDGVSLTVSELTAFGTLGDLTGSLYIGQNGNSSSYFDGRIDEVRISKGVARWTSGFTPPSSAYTSDSNTVLLLHLDGDVTDSGNTGHTVTNNNVGYGAFDFNGTSEFINVDTLITDIASDTTGSFSCWLYRDNMTANKMIFDITGSTVSNWGRLRSSSDGKLDFYIQNSGGDWMQATTQTTPISATTWYHIVVTQDGTADGITIYVNGSSVSLTYTENGAFDGSEWWTDITSATNGRIACSTQNGAGSESNFLDGRIDDFRYYQNKVLTSSEVEAIYQDGNGTEDDQPTATTKNMTLISDTFTAEAQPDSGRIVILEENVDSVTINTDLLAYASRDGGSSWVQGTLADEGDYDASKQILVADFDFTASGVGAGTSMEYKLETANNKNLKIHGTSLNWD